MKAYLVIWQLGTNEYSRTETPLDLAQTSLYTAEEIYEKIKSKLRKKDDTADSDKLRILGIYQL